ncbi:MAG: 4Fe-4S binding protein [Clostridia bacterium]|nr:4Fe-4S binding protein [Clostridia bacterium]
MAFRINEDKCIGCGACAWACLFEIPRKAEDGVKYTIDGEKCYGCGHCENICPNNAIEPMPDHKKLKKVTIDPEKCEGCSLCAHICPEKAPFGERGKPFTIMQEKCMQCGACAVRCRFDAIITEY